MFKNFQDILDRDRLKKEPKELIQICSHLFSKGKSLRARLVSAISSPLQIETENIKWLCRLIEYIHVSSLLHDDFIDQSETRRGMKTAWLEFSPEQAVLAGDYLLSQVNLYLADKKNLKLIEITSHSIADLARGEFLQRELRGFHENNIEKWNQVTEFKTGSLFKWCLKAPFLFQQRESKDLYQLLDKIGCYFGLIYQRSDDLLDFGINQEEDSKPVLLDLKQSYYNSFSCHLMKDASLEVEKQYQNCKTTDEIHKVVPFFEQSLKEFHQASQVLIDETNQEIDKLQSFLEAKEQVVVDRLKDFSSLFYWRNQAGSL